MSKKTNNTEMELLINLIKKLNNASNERAEKIAKHFVNRTGSIKESINVIEKIQRKIDETIQNKGMTLESLDECISFSNKLGQQYRKESA